jgi:haloalkane dehalogenase
MLEAVNVEKYSLVVHDFGGPIALDGALDDPSRLERLVVFNSFAWPFTDSARGSRLAHMARTSLFRWLYRSVNLSFVISKSAWGKGFRSASLWKQYARVFPDADSRERVLWALARSMTLSTPFFESLSSRLGRLSQTPIHIVWGLADTALTPESLARFRQAWPHATVAELPDAGHWPHEEDPARCCKEVSEFLLGRI